MFDTFWRRATRDPEVPTVRYPQEKWTSCKKTIVSATDDIGPIVAEHHLAWNVRLQSNENPYVKMMIFGCKPSERQNSSTPGYLFDRASCFESNEKPRWLFIEMYVPQQYRKKK